MKSSKNIKNKKSITKRNLKMPPKNELWFGFKCFRNKNGEVAFIYVDNDNQVVIIDKKPDKDGNKVITYSTIGITIRFNEKTNMVDFFTGTKKKKSYDPTTQINEIKRQIKNLNKKMNIVVV
jgi:hypothetical protein